MRAMPRLKTALLSLRGAGDKSGHTPGGIERGVTLARTALRSLRGTGDKIAGGTRALGSRLSKFEGVTGRIAGGSGALGSRLSKFEGVTGRIAGVIRLDVFAIAAGRPA
jgi:hypothetical protein